MNIKQYTVFVGGVEVTDYLLTKENANKLKQHYIDEGYDDVKILKY